jgi:hypothetical protein
MKHVTRILGTVVTLALAAAAQAGPAPRQILEGAIETYTNEITLPVSTGGTILVRHCERCGGRTLITNSATQYYIGTRLASLQQMNAYLSSGKRFPTTIFYNASDGSVSRVAAGK